MPAKDRHPVETFYSVKCIRHVWLSCISNVPVEWGEFTTYGLGSRVLSASIDTIQWLSAVAAEREMLPESIRAAKTYKSKSSSSKEATFATCTSS